VSEHQHQWGRALWANGSRDGWTEGWMWQCHGCGLQVAPTEKEIAARPDFLTSLRAMAVEEAGGE
jgi:hypothetical protein